METDGLMGTWFKIHFLYTVLMNDDEKKQIRQIGGIVSRWKN